MRVGRLNWADRPPCASVVKMSLEVAYHILWGKEIIVAAEKLVRRK